MVIIHFSLYHKKEATQCAAHYHLSSITNSEATRIIVESEKVQGVIINGEERLESDFVISNMHPQRTLEILDKNRSIKNAYISRIRSLENTYGIFTLYLIMKKRSTPYQNRNLYLHANNKVWYDKLLYPGRTTNCMISMQASSEDSQYASVISILTPMYIDELSAWRSNEKHEIPGCRKAFQDGERSRADSLAFRSSGIHNLIAIMKFVRWIFI